MASIGINAIHRANCISQNVTNKQSLQERKSVGAKQESHAITLKQLNFAGEGENLRLATEKSERFVEEIRDGNGSGSAETMDQKFKDHRWKNGSWDLNMFVKKGKMDWDEVIVSEARRRKFLEMYPEASTNEDPVLFRTSIIPWWAWIMYSHLPEAELLNGRAAMVGFFMAYIVDGLTGLDVVGQSGNFICKAALFVTIMGILLFRRKEDISNLQKLADEATFYDKQWQASWQVQDPSNDVSPEKVGKHI